MLAETQTCFLSLGSNLGESRNYLKKAVEFIGNDAKNNQIVGISSVYQAKAWGKTDQPDFLNLVLELQTKWDEIELMENLLEIEKMMGRTRTVKWGERIIDIDILLYGNSIVNSPQLTLPHPEMHRRKFVLVPLVELAPNVFHPVHKKNSSQLLGECQDESPVLAVGKLFE